MPSNADFTIDGDAFANLGFDTTQGTVVALQLEDSPALDVRSTSYRVVQQSAGSDNIPELGAPGSGGASPSPNPQDALNVTIPATGDPGIWIVQCQINGGKDALGAVVPSFTKERAIVTRIGGGLRKIAPAESTQYDAIYGWTEAFNSAIQSLAGTGFGARPLVGVAGRQASDSIVETTVGSLALRLGDVVRGLPASGRTITLEALLQTTSAAVGAQVDFYNHTTSQVVGSVLASVLTTGPELVELDVTAEVGTSLLEDTINLIAVRLRQTNLNAAERAYVDFANIDVSY